MSKFKHDLVDIDEDGDKDKLYSNGKITVGKAKQNYGSIRNE